MPKKKLSRDRLFRLHTHPTPPQCRPSLSETLVNSYASTIHLPWSPPPYPRTHEKTPFDHACAAIAIRAQTIQDWILNFFFFFRMDFVIDFDFSVYTSLRFRIWGEERCTRFKREDSVIPFSIYRTRISFSFFLFGYIKMKEGNIYKE